MENVGFRPLKDKILVKRNSINITSAGGIIIPDAINQEKPDIGEVLAVGSLVKDVEVCDQILFGKYAGHEIKLNGNEYIIMQEQDVMGVLIHD